MIFDDDAAEASEETTDEAVEETVDEPVEEEASDEAVDEAVDEASDDASDEDADETSGDESSEDEGGEEAVAEEAAAEGESSEESADEAEEVSADESSDESEETAESSGESAEGDAELTLGESSEEAEEPRIPRQPTLIRGKIDRHGVAIGTGRRKTSVARVRVVDGDGGMTINGRDLDDYFQIERDRLLIEAPLKATETYGSVNVWVRVNGGGLTGQAGAIVLGIARALQAKNPNLHEALSDGGYLTRDDRMVERKKYGYKKARKSFQFSKR